MRIICPSCEAAYEVPDAVLTPGRKLRCARCQSDWAPLPSSAVPPPLVVPPPPAVPRPEIYDRVPEIPPIRVGREAVARLTTPVVETAVPGWRSGRGAAVMAAWVLSFAILGGAGWGFVAYRAAVGHAWPPANRVYAALGYSR